MFYFSLNFPIAGVVCVDICICDQICFQIEFRKPRFKVLKYIHSHIYSIVPVSAVGVSNAVQLLQLELRRVNSSLFIENML